MIPLTPLSEIPPTPPYKKGDVMVVFGELFSRGYANGIVDAAKVLGMKIIYSTVGRRDGTNLRALTADELAASPQPLINVPLEAGFDMDPSKSGSTPVDHLKGVKMDEWDKVQLDWKQIEESQRAGQVRFRENVKKFVAELTPQIPKTANVLFVHTMAGGVPRAKIYMPTMNRIFKGRGDRHESSEKFQQSDLGQLAERNFNEVTADTFKVLVEETNNWRKMHISGGASVRYVCYGYHGTEVLMGKSYQWQTYTPYFQGWAKLRLENWAYDFWERSTLTTVFNCPEILTNSSSVFQGVEVSLYPLIGALKKEAGDSPYVKNVLDRCRELLKANFSLENIVAFTERYLLSPLVQRHSHYPDWPEHNSQEQMELMLSSSDELIAMHKDPKNLITALLSEEVFKACGSLMLAESWQARGPVLWLGHQVIARQLARYQA